MADPFLIAVAAYGRGQSLSNEECLDVWRRYEWATLPDDAVLTVLDAAILGVKRARRPVPLPPARTYEEWLRRARGDGEPGD